MSLHERSSIAGADHFNRLGVAVLSSTSFVTEKLWGKSKLATVASSVLDINVLGLLL